MFIRIERINFDPTNNARYSVETGVAPGYLQARTIVELVSQLQQSGSLGQVCPREPYGSVYMPVSHTKH